MATYVVGDLHGQLHLLEPLLKKVRFHPVEDLLYSVGDVVDRGTDTGPLLDYLYDGARAGWFRPVLGNHEELLLAYRNNPARHKESYLDPGFGGRVTLSALERTPRAREILDWIATWPLTLEVGGHILVHGGLPRIQGSSWGDVELCEKRVDPDTGFRHCLWVRIPDIYPSFDQKMVVSGHNMIPQAQHYKDGILLIDTGGYRTGSLTLYRIEDRTLHTGEGRPRLG
jgi:serine/threonine protein phosphatase 1